MAYDVLIVDDSQMMRKWIRKSVILSKFDVGECWEAEDGRAALEVLKDHWIDLILTDLNMPRMDGLEMLKEIRKNEVLRNVPVVLVSTEKSEERLRELQALGIQGYIQKPFFPETIAETLNRIMGAAHV